MNSRESITVDRLFAAADAVLVALETPGGIGALVSGTLQHPHKLAAATDYAFTQNELVEAMAMLIRLGLVSTRRAGS